MATSPNLIGGPFVRPDEKQSDSLQNPQLLIAAFVGEEQHVCWTSGPFQQDLLLAGVAQAAATDARPYPVA
jgi:hypothetical protein